MSEPSTQKNRLKDATSPYLLQHAKNPVHWHPWDATSLELAHSENKPILLSIGYSACHWCHVMAHESFEDSETAELMNRLFVNIKVDREERPDLDKIYQTAHQLLARRPGGWPLTVFLTPKDQVPFFAGTYFPDSPRHGMPAFKEILKSIARAYEEHGQDIDEQNVALMQALNGLNPRLCEDSFTPESGPLLEARLQLERSFDPVDGGFGSAPKFPHSGNLEHLVRHWAASVIENSPDDQALYIARFTLEHIARGGIFDHLGGGFFRYSVDKRWMIPHFEKMLYDNALLQTLYCDIWQITGEALFADTVRATADWTIREMQSAEGGYYSSLDADSEGEEGKFYVWSREETRALIGQEDQSLFAYTFGLDQPPNFEGRWHLYRHHDLTESARRFNLSLSETERRLASARARLLTARNTRVRPGCDDKILTSWNALMIKAMARGARVFGETAYQDSADRALSFIRRRLWKNDRLMASHRQGKSHLNAYLDDYAFLLDALLELLKNRWRRDDLDFALELADVLLERFVDKDQGGFFFTADDHERLIHRPKSIADDALPSGNAVAAQSLIRLGHLIGEPRYLKAAEQTISNAWEQIKAFPHAHCTLLSALRDHLNPGELIVIRGDPEDAAKWHQRAFRRYAPQRYSLAIPDFETDLPGALGYRLGGNCTRAYRCVGTHCEPPIRDFEVFDNLMKQKEISPTNDAV